ncbi:IPTL-CTERM sorting domain-containing protein [Pseudomonadota bacterium]
MNLKRAFLITTAALLLPGMALAQVVDARFLVTKDFADDNTTSINVVITCNTGVPLSQDADITEVGGGVGFVVTSFDPAIGSCTITEDGEAGYTGSYVANGGAASATSCVIDSTNWIADADQTCAITNAATPVDVSITKVWNMEGAGGNEVDTDSTFYITSMGSITGGSPCLDGPMGDNGYNCRMLHFYGEGTQSVAVTPAVGGTDVYIDELNLDSAVEVSDDCDGMVTVAPADAAQSCTFTNTVFFEGIPTLNQYGMAILVLLMLGVGFVGFRRFA